MDVADYTIHEKRVWRRVKPSEQIIPPMTGRKFAAIVLAAHKQLKEAYATGRATPPACSFNRGGFDADRLPKRQNRHTA